MRFAATSGVGCGDFGEKVASNEVCGHFRRGVGITTDTHTQLLMKIFTCFVIIYIKGGDNVVLR